MHDYTAYENSLLEGLGVIENANHKAKNDIIQLTQEINKILKIYYKKPSLKGSLSNELGNVKPIVKQSIDLPSVKETVTEIHKAPENITEIELKGVLVKIDKDLHKKIKSYCVERELEMQEYFNDAIHYKAKIDKIL